MQSGANPRESTQRRPIPKDFLRNLNLRNPQIGILVLNHNGQNWLPTIYQSIREQSYPRAKMYLVDNASTDSSVQWTQEEYPEVTILRMPSNLGYCMAYNVAMKQAFSDQCEWVIWANNDVKLEAGCLSGMVEAAQSDARMESQGLLSILERMNRTITSGKLSTGDYGHRKPRKTLDVSG
jgi:GT2 family glycosyltransferase